MKALMKVLWIPLLVFAPFFAWQFFLFLGIGQGSSWLIPLVIFAPFFVWLLLIRRKSGPDCPDCGELLPQFQSPFTKTERMWRKGGHICRNCGCETDIAGNKVPAGVAPQRLWIAISFGATILSMGLALMLLIVRLLR